MGGVESNGQSWAPGRWVAFRSGMISAGDPIQVQTPEPATPREGARQGAVESANEVGGYMANPVLGSEPAELGEQGMAGDEAQMAMAPERSYHPTRWPLVNRALDLVESMFPGKAGFVQRLVSYLIVGGGAAVVNLIVFTIMFYHVPLPFSDKTTLGHTAHYLTAFLVGTEVSIFANFIPNDYLTFRHLAGHQRSWIARCARFHITCIAGTLLTLAISFTLHFAGLNATVGQAIALIVVTAFNFTFHHLFTYRHVKPAEE